RKPGTRICRILRTIDHFRPEARPKAVARPSSRLLHCHICSIRFLMECVVKVGVSEPCRGPSRLRRESTFRLVIPGCGTCSYPLGTAGDAVSVTGAGPPPGRRPRTHHAWHDKAPSTPSAEGQDSHHG